MVRICRPAKPLITHITFEDIDIDIENLNWRSTELNYTLNLIYLLEKWEQMFWKQIFMNLFNVINFSRGFGFYSNCPDLQIVQEEASQNVDIFL